MGRAMLLGLVRGLLLGSGVLLLGASLMGMDAGRWALGAVGAAVAVSALGAALWWRGWHR